MEDFIVKLDPEKTGGVDAIYFKIDSEDNYAGGYIHTVDGTIREFEIVLAE